MSCGTARGSRGATAASITLACVAAAAVDEPIQQHVYAALASGDITREEFQEVVLHFAYYAGWPRASALEMAYYRRGRAPRRGGTRDERRHEQWLTRSRIPGGSGRPTC